MGASARAALVAVIAATGATATGYRLCGLLMNEATAQLMTAPALPLERLGMGEAGVTDRLASVAVLGQVCAACSACPRGRALAGDLPTTPAPMRPSAA